MQVKFSIAGSRREVRAVVLAPAMMEEAAAPLMLYGAAFAGSLDQRQMGLSGSVVDMGPPPRHTSPS